MKYNLSLTVITLIISTAACNQKINNKVILGEQNAITQVRSSISDTSKQIPFDSLIKDSQTAISVVEPILFDIYGKDQIINERPYECYLVDGFWYITGTLPSGWVGGTFEVILNSRNAQIVRLTHYK